MWKINIGSSGGLGDEKHDFGGRDRKAEVVNDVVDTTCSPKAVQVSEGVDLEGRTTPSADDESLSAAQKHSVTVKVTFLVFMSFFIFFFCVFFILSY